VSLLLLDTSTFLWFITASPKLPRSIGDAVRHAESEIWFSVVSFWEILVKHQLGRLPLPEAPASYIPRQRERHRIASLGLDEDSLTHLPRLPALHRDPFDRMLICQAIEHNLRIVTPDPSVRQYPVRTQWAQDDSQER